MSLNKGTEFEKMINEQNEIYKAQNIAVINKRSTPMVIKGTKKGMFLCVFDKKKSTVDYDGVYQGKSIQFDAKSVLDIPRFDLRLLEDHQREHLQACYDLGAACFLLIWFTQVNEIYMLPFTEYMKHYRNSLKDGRQSIKLSEFQSEYVKVEGTDYLKGLNFRYIG